MTPKPTDNHINAAYEHGILGQDGKWRNHHRNFVPAGNVSTYDKKKEDMLIPLLNEAKRIATELEDFKRRAFAAWHEFGQDALEDYGVEINTEKGNGTLYSFEQQHKAQMCSTAVIEFDNRIQAAASLIKECFDSWGEGADPNLMAVVNGAFDTDSKGMINVRKLLGLGRMRVDDERWQKAMDAIHDATLEVCRASYLNFYEREEVNGKAVWKLIPLSLARA